MKGGKQDQKGIISILVCRVHTTCGAGGGKNQGGVKGAKGSEQALNPLKRSQIPEKAPNPQKGPESMKRPQIPKKAPNPQKGGQREERGVKGVNREQREQRHFYTRF